MFRLTNPLLPGTKVDYKACTSMIRPGTTLASAIMTPCSGVRRD